MAVIACLVNDMQYAASDTMPATPTVACGPIPGTPSLLSERMRKIAEDEARETVAVVTGPTEKVMVLNTQRKRVHLVDTTKTTSACGWWSCGTKAEPAWNAKFEGAMVETKCVRCFCK